MTELSIIIPHFNSEKSLVRLLETIPLSNDIQVVVVDDNSDSFDIEYYRKAYPKYEFHINTRGKGAGGARNTGLTFACGTWVTFADSDDYFCEKELENVLALISEKDVNADIVFFKPSSVFLNEERKATRHKKYAELVADFIRESSDINKTKLLFSHYVPWSKFIKLDLIKNNNIHFDETIIANDGMFSAKCSLLSKETKAYENEIYTVTVSSDSLTKIKNVEFFRVRIEVFTRMYHFLPSNIKKIIGMSPLSLVRMSLIYGLSEFARTVIYFRRNNVKFFRYLNFASLRRFILSNK
ncbi:hypothetical protein MTsDn1_29570 [Alteromonas sp. MTD1]|uniref:glycosyltransferase family 2 protein n=1 Tax=Alteromonas sp. MTD1 TaxID=3057962 RepID=UPI0036F3E2D0